MTKEINITASYLQKAQSRRPEKRVIEWDGKLKGFGIKQTTKGMISYIVNTRVNGRLVQVTVGRYPELSAPQARKKAAALLVKMRDGVNPNQKDPMKDLEGITLERAYKDYTETRELKPITIGDMQRTINQVMPTWWKKRLLDITPMMIERKHREHGKTRSKAKANAAMRYLRALFNFAAEYYIDEKGRSPYDYNPVLRLTKLKAWHKVERKSTYIKKESLGAWWQATETVSEIARDYLRLVLLTGFRKQEAAKLEWKHIDFTNGTITALDTKNGKDHTLPMSTYLKTLLERRFQAKINGYVFPSFDGKKHYATPTRSTEQHPLAMIDKQTGFNCTIHDLRRTFATYAESLDIPAYALKGLLNHSRKADVTAGYIQLEVERLRKPMQRITDEILSLAGAVDSGDNIIKLPTNNV